jgi:hypothetical protein
MSRSVIEAAVERADAEATAVAAKSDGLEAFTERLESLSTTQLQEAATQTVGGQLTSSGGTDRRAKVRTAFAETVVPHTEAESTLTALRVELGDAVALALAPTTQTALTPELRTQLLTASRTRQRELAVTEQALREELEQVESAAEMTTELVEWLRSVDETPLSDLGFPALRRRHERLCERAQQLRELSETRQSFLHGTTSSDATVGVRNRDLVTSVYEDFSVSYPVLSTVCQLHDTIEDCRSVVRNHLVRRV